MKAIRRLRLAAVPFVAAALLATGMARLAVAKDASPDVDEKVALVTARDRAAKNDVDGAIFSLSTYVAEHPGAAEPARFLGDLEYRRGDFASAELTYRRILDDDATDVLTHDHLGRLYTSRGRVREAIDQFEKTLPSSSGYAHLVALHRERGDLDAFVLAFRLRADEHRDNPKAQFAFGTIDRALHQPGEALPYLQRAVSLGPTCDTLSELGNTEYDLGHFGSAIEAFTRCLAIDPDDYSATLDLGNVHLVMSEDATARTLFERAMALDPLRSEALVDLGYVDDVARNWEDAVSLYLRAIAVDPLLSEAYVDLGFDYDAHGLFARAETVYRAGLTIAPASGRLHFLLGMTYLHQGKRDLAIGECKRATGSDEPEVAHAASRELQTLAHELD